MKQHRLVFTRNTGHEFGWQSCKPLTLSMKPQCALAAFYPLSTIAFTTVITVFFTTHATWSIVSRVEFLVLQFAFPLLHTAILFLLRCTL